MTQRTSVERFQFDFDPKYRGFLRLVGVHPGNSEVTVGEGKFRARFGPVRASTPVENIAGVEVTGDYHWWKAIGIRLSLTDGGATFGTNTDVGVCVKFHEPIPIYFGRLRPHPGLTVTIEDPDGLVAAIEEHRTSADAEG